MMHVKIKKADGTLEYFKVEKLRRSLRRAGATPDEVNGIVAEVQTTLYDGMLTQEIYRNAFTLLRDSRPPAAARYSLRRALFSLGPTGFPFEKFLGRLFEAQGYSTTTGVTLQGRCAPHEIDIVAYKKDHSFIGEAKFHSRPGTKSDLQVAMYSYARLLDLKGHKVCEDDVCGVKDFWLITNTKFTSTAIDYGRCVGIKMLSWDYPKHENLHDFIQRERIYPITVLQTLSQTQIRALISRNIILCRDIKEQPYILRHLHISLKKHEAVMTEIDGLCHNE
jgi:hypothetical protein